MNVFEELRAGKPYHILDPDYVEQVHGEMKRCRHLCWKIGQTDPDEREEIVRLEEELLGPLKGGTFLTPPFQVDLGCRLFLGENVFANHGLTVMSVGTITIDDGYEMAGSLQGFDALGIGLAHFLDRPVIIELVGKITVKQQKLV